MDVILRAKGVVKACNRGSLLQSLVKIHGVSLYNALKCESCIACPVISQSCLGITVDERSK